MKTRVAVFTIYLTGLMAMAACEAEPVRVTNGPRPSQTIRNWHLKEEWRAGNQKYEFLSGSIADVTTDRKGNTYLQDYQLQKTYVFDPKGKFLKALDLEGEGPTDPLRARDPHGRIWVAPERDRYFLKVLDPDGRTVMETMREYASVNRAKKSPQSIEVGEHPPCIEKLWIMENRWGTEVWIESGASHHDLPPGVMVRYDLFDLDGKFTHQVDIVGDGDPLRDRWYLVGDNRLIMVRNALAGRYQKDDPTQPRPEDEALEIISYRILWEE